eukprot:TRINITY_DN12317_c0_g1_i1.p1 TRINITY_DN12317_c0_g1~~TRINITY_DN12317_c0_g1_i1.p1  ORF type:complete len:174 (+),score=9.00 TRINITY_DN12317_c0_g1_i1:71-592(+)
MGSSCTTLLSYSLPPHRGRVGGVYKKDASRVEKTNAAWKKQLSAQEYAVLRLGGTDRPNTGIYNKVLPTSGYFQCRACGTPLYSWQAKFKCGCGWPAFSKCYKGHVKTRTDNSIGLSRIEIMCSGCDGHLGHVFVGEGLTKSNERHCVNSTSIHYVDAKGPNIPEVTVASSPA